MEIDATTPQPGEVASANPEVTAPETTPNTEVQEQTPAPVEQVEKTVPVVTGSNETSNLEAKRRASEMFLRRENRRLREQLEKASQPQSATPQAQLAQRIGLFEDPDKFMAQHDEELANRILAGLEQRETAKMSAQKEQEAHKILEQLSLEGHLERVQEIIDENPALNKLDTFSAVQIVQKMIGGSSTPVARQTHALTPRKSLAGVSGGGTSGVGMVRPSVAELKAKVSSMQSEFGVKHNDPEFMKQWNKAKSELQKINQSEN